MKLFSKKLRLTFVPFLVVLFLLIVSAVTSYVVINQGTGGYKSRADAGDDIAKCSARPPGYKFCSSYKNAVLECVSTSIIPKTAESCKSGFSCSSAKCVSSSVVNPNSVTACTVKQIGAACGSGKCTQNGNVGGASIPGIAVCDSASKLSCQNGKCVSTNLSTCDSNGNSCCWGSLGTQGANFICDSRNAPGLKCNHTTLKCEGYTKPPETCSSAGNTCCSAKDAGGPTEYYCKSGLFPSSQSSSCSCGSTPAPGAGASNYGQGNGSCSATFSGATCKDTSSCSGTPTSGYCPGPATWKCCVPPGAAVPNNPAPPGPGGGGTSSCAGGVLCDGTAVTGAAGETVCGQADTSGTCRSWSCNGSTGTWSYVGDACTVAPPVEPPVTEPPATTGDATLALTLRLQGVTGNPKGSKTVPFKVKLKNATSTTDYVTGTLTVDSTGKWKGSVPFSGIELGADTGYSVYIKVGKHLQKRVCVTAPDESPVGTYSCSDNTIPLVAGANNLDFSNILQLVGDLPSSSGEQNGRVDGYDKGFLLNHQRSTNQADLQIGDLNFDGVLDTNDWSLILQSLNVKYDDE